MIEPKPTADDLSTKTDGQIRLRLALDGVFLMLDQPASCDEIWQRFQDLLYTHRLEIRDERESLYLSTIRDLLNLLDTAEGYWITDRERYFQGLDGRFWLHAEPGTYFRQSFKDSPAVKRARALLDSTSN